MSKPMHSSASKSAPSLLDAPVSPTSKTYFPIPPTTPSMSTKSVSRSPSPIGPSLGRKTSLMDDWVLEDGPLPYAPRQKKLTGSKPPTNGTVRHVSDSMVRQSSQTTPPLIQFESPPQQYQKPPLPPRKASYSSLKSVSLSNSSSSSLAPLSPNAPATPLPPPALPARRKSDSLTVDQYPPPGKLGISIPSRRNGSGHVPASSISSFHSVSLSSDGGVDLQTPGSVSNFVATFPSDRDDREGENGREQDNASLDESFENVSVSSIASPSVSSVIHGWAEFTRRPSEPPKLPRRPTPGSSPSNVPSASTPAISVPYAVRPTVSKPAPPPPPSRTRAPPPPSNRSSLNSTSASSDRSSVISQATSRTSVSSYRPSVPPKTTPTASPQLLRPTPVPPAAKRRYETVFNKNILVQRRMSARAPSPPMGRKTRQAAGWRGLSVDLITNPQENGAPEAVDGEVGPEERLSGQVVAAMWKCSKLERRKLREIWCVHWRNCNRALLNGRWSLTGKSAIRMARAASIASPSSEGCGASTKSCEKLNSRPGAPRPCVHRGASPPCCDEPGPRRRTLSEMRNVVLGNCWTSSLADTPRSLTLYTPAWHPPRPPDH